MTSEDIPSTGLEAFVDINGCRHSIDEAVETYRRRLLAMVKQQTQLFLIAEAGRWESLSPRHGTLNFQVGIRRLDPITRLGALARAEVEPDQQGGELSCMDLSLTSL